ncbi:MAG: hypothetical protein KJ893_06600 [Candidatus Omnitrophica bacterium]|nr:hypothetical protein [Candidatus Omnitrophota bacterium]MBU4478061.1 hypothetical protein [Candidatus Omnitrophota bacterium]
MKIYIEDSVTEKNNFKFEKHLISLLRYVPKAHIDKLGCIKVVDKSLKSKDGNECRGMYYASTNNEDAIVFLSAEAMFKGMPKLFFLIPLIPKFTLSYSLYHEIGHHYQRNFTHGIKKELAEKNADNYAKKMQQKAFKPYFGFFLLIFWPFLLIRSYLKKVGKW